MHKLIRILRLSKQFRDRSTFARSYPIIPKLTGVKQVTLHFGSKSTITNGSIMDPLKFIKISLMRNTTFYETQLPYFRRKTAKL